MMLITASNRMVKETYGFKSKHHPGKCKELETFEKDLYNIVSSLKYRNQLTTFSNKWQKISQV